MDTLVVWIIATLTISTLISCVMGHTSIKEKAKPVMGIVDYSLVGGLLLISCGVGTIINFWKRDKDPSLNLSGVSIIHVVPMALSLATNFFTAIEYLGNPAEFYLYGGMYGLICVTFFIAVPITSYFYLPVFMKLRLMSCYEYLELRFSKRIRIIASVLYIIQTLNYTAVAVYAPASAVSNVTPIDKNVAIALVFVVCAFYTTIGGLKAVIFTDSFQSMVLLTSLLFVVITGVVLTDDVKAVFTYAYETGRLDFNNFSLDMTERHNVFSLIVGGTFYWNALFCANQASTQKYMSVATISEARKALWFTAFALTFIFSTGNLIGMLILYHFRNCDPLKSGMITAPDQLLPLYVMETMGFIPGAIGFVIAGTLAASLGTVAAALTSIVSAFMQDIVGSLYGHKIPESQQVMVTKIITMVSALVSYALVYVVEPFKSILQLAITFNGIAGGINSGLFTLGMFFPRANAKGAFVGVIAAFLVVGTIGSGSLYHIVQEDIVTETKILVANCTIHSDTINAETTLESLKELAQVFPLFSLSYLWYSAIGCIITVVVGLIVSYLTESSDADPDLLSPPVVNWLRKLEEKFGWNFNIKKPETVNTVQIREEFEMHVERY